MIGVEKGTTEINTRTHFVGARGGSVWFAIFFYDIRKMSTWMHTRETERERDRERDRDRERQSDGRRGE